MIAPANPRTKALGLEGESFLFFFFAVTVFAKISNQKTAIGLFLALLALGI